jgi:hypothetical protein
VYEIEGGKLEIEGLIKGTTVANISGEITCYDTRNKIFGHVAFDPDGRLKGSMFSMFSGKKK